MRSKSAVSTSIDTLSDVIDSVPFDSLPDLSLSDLHVPDLSSVTDAFADASTVVVDTAVVVGRRGSRLATRTARSAWANRETVATVAVFAILVLAAVSLMKRRREDDTDAT